MKIMLDAGHGYHTAGKRSPDGMREYEFNRMVAHYAKSQLEEYENIIVYMAHSDKDDVLLQARTDKANRLAIDCYVSIHANAYGSTWNEANGVETYIYDRKHQEAFQLAQKVQRNIVASTGLANRGVKTADFHVLRETNMTAILVECGFMTNKTEIKLLRSPTFQRACAEAITKGLADQYHLKKKTQPASSTKPTESSTNKKGLYKVQTGAFSNRKTQKI